MDNIEQIERFYKHRRNMLLLSGIFLFLVLSGGTVSQISILGSRLEFSNPDAPVQILFLALLYMLIKYFQFLSELNGTGIKSKIHTLVLQEVPSITHQFATKQGSAENFEISNYDIIEQKGFFTFKVIQDVSRLKVTEFKQTKLDKIKLRGQSNTYTIGLKQLWLVYIKAFFHVLIKTTWFAEYVMPLLLAIFGIYLYIFTDTHTIIWLNANNSVN